MQGEKPICPQKVETWINKGPHFFLYWTAVLYGCGTSLELQQLSCNYKDKSQGELLELSRLALFCF